MKRFHSSYAIRSRFYLSLIRVNFERKQEGYGSRGIEQVPREGSRREVDKWGPRPAGLHPCPIVVALLQTCRLGVLCSREVALANLMKNVGRPAWFRPPGLNSRRILFKFLWNAGSVLLVWNHRALDERSEQGCGWHTHAHQPQEHKEEQLFIFILFKSKVGCCCIQLNPSIL